MQAGGTTRYLYNGDSVILTTSGTALFAVQEYITPGVGLFKVGQSGVNPAPLSATIAAGTVVSGQMIFNQENALGSTIATRNADGSLGGRWEYDAYGNERSRPASGITVDLRTDFRFAGKHGYISDPDTGFDLLGARYYIPRLGRFLTQDPIGHAGGLNLYAYCENNPLSKVDPDGKDGEFIRALFSGEVWGKGLMTSGAALGSSLSMGLYDGGAYKNEPGFSQSRTSWDVAQICLSGARGLATAGKKAAETLAETRLAGTAYRQLAKILAKSGMEAHHIVQSRFAGLFGLNSKEMMSVALTHAEHVHLDNLWRQVLPYGRNYTAAQVRAAIPQVYRNYPELREIAFREIRGR